MLTNYRTLWLSDIHLGSKASRADDLLTFLRCVHAERIYLVGDVIDLKRMKVKPLFTPSHVQVTMTLLNLVGQGTEVIFIPGNHDFEFRKLAGSDLAGVSILLEAEHVTAAGLRLLVTHGDVLDGRIRKGTNLEKFGAAAYALMLDIDVVVNRLRRVLGQEFFPLSTYVKRRLRRATEYIRRFEDVATKYAADRGFDGIVCGHIHRPKLRTSDGILYANDGDWVEHRTALAERADGTMDLLEWRAGNVLVSDSLEVASQAA